MSERFDVAIVGAGMAGASLAAELSPHRSVLLIEAEDQPGYHATGRSAAFWSETYGGPLVQPLTRASHGFLSEHGFLHPRGAIHLADAAGDEALAGLGRMFEATDVALEPMGRPALEGAIPGLKQGWDQALAEPGVADIDVAALHAFYLAQAKRNGARLVTGARFEKAMPGWMIETRTGTFPAALLVDAAGAWADEVAERAGVQPVGIRPYRRTMVQLATDPAPPSDLPLVIDAAGRFYFKPEAGGRLWLSPHDETPCLAQDCAPEDIDVAHAVERLGQVVDWKVVNVERSWAGLRSFAPDRLPVYGFAPDRPDFFWFAGQGGFGIQTAPAAARLASSLILGTVPELDPAPYAPGRFTN